MSHRKTVSHRKDDSDRPGPSRHIGLLKYAEDFADAATTVVNANAPYKLVNKAHVALYYLCGHAIELALKSVLRLHGDSDEFLKGKIGHNLDRALKRATSYPQNRFFSKELNQAVENLNLYYPGKYFEYYDRPALMNLTERRKLVGIVNTLIENLDKEYRVLWRDRQTPGAGSGR